MKATVHNIADEKQVKKAQKNEKFIEKQKEEDYRAVLSTRSGRRLLWGLLGDLGLHEQPFTGNNTTFFNCGKLNSAQIILGNIVDADQEAYFQMMRESKDEE